MNIVHCFIMSSKGMLWSVSNSLNASPSPSSNPTQEQTDFGAKMSPEEFGAKMSPEESGAKMSPEEFGAKIDPTMTSSSQSADNQPFVAPEAEKPRGIFSKLFGVIKNSMFKLASKLGYIKKPTGTPADSPSASWSPLPGWFQCMIKADVPVLVQNNPVWVRHPQATVLEIWKYLKIF
jgi:hypothetical protein